MSPQQALLTAPIGSSLVRLAAPNGVAMAVMFATTAAETWYVGQIGTTALAGLALAFPLFMLTTMLSAGSIGGAIAGAVAQRLGAGDREGAEILAFHAVLLALVLAALFSALLLFGGPVFYSLLGGRGAVLEQALSYSNVLFAGGVTVWLAHALASVIRATGHMQVAAAAMVASSMIQVVLGGLLVFGIGPFPKLGIAGVAAATVVAFAVAVAIQLVFLMRHCRSLRLRLRHMPVRIGPFVALLRIGLLASLSPLSSVATVILITGFVARLGPEVLAGYGIGARLEFLMIPLIFGIGAALITMVGVHFGAGDVDRGHRIAWTGAGSAALITGAIGAVLAAFPGLWADLFTDAPLVRETCRTYLRIVGPFYAFYGLGLCCYFASQGARRVLWPVLAGLVRLGVIAAGGFLILHLAVPTPALLFALISLAMLVYGAIAAGSVWLGAWRTS